MTNQEIISNGPEGWTHINGATIYINDQGQLDFKGDNLTEAAKAFFQCACTLKNNEVTELNKHIKELEQEREKNYEKWQAKYQYLKDSMPLTECYECGTPVHELSPRSRCYMCEYGRAQFNERDNEVLRHCVAELEQENQRDRDVYEDIVKNQRDTICLFMPSSEYALKKLQKRDLEQQAKGVEDALHEWRLCSDSNVRVNLKHYANLLRQQAEELK